MSILIIGGGEIGGYIAEKMIGEGKAVVIIEKDERKAAGLCESLDAKIICGNGAAPHVLKEADIKIAEMVIAVTDSDEVNLLATMLAGLEAPQAVRIARIRNREFDIEGERFEHDLHINLAINPDKEAARAIEDVLRVPGSTDFMEFFDGRLNLIGTVALPHSPLVNRPLKELSAIKEKGRFLVAAVFRDNQLIVPSGDSLILPGDNIYFVAKADKTMEGMRLLGQRGEKVADIMIYGGGFIGSNLASVLEHGGVNVKVAEPDPKKCSTLNRALGKSIILNATASDQDFLKEENIDKLDAFVAVTGDDEENIMSALLAKKLGCPLSIAISHKSAYMPFISTIGIDVVFNPRQLTINAILQFIRKGRVLHASTLKESGEIIEVEALETSDLVGEPIRKLNLPDGVLVLSISHGDEIVVPGGSTVIEAGDRVLLMVTRAQVHKLEKFITAKPEYF